MLIKYAIFFVLFGVQFSNSFLLSAKLNTREKLSRSVKMQSTNKSFKAPWWKVAVASTGILSCSFAPQSPAIAADTVKVGKCLLQSCQKELAQCILNPKCLANVICLNACNGRKDEAECEIKCGMQLFALLM